MEVFLCAETSLHPHAVFLDLLHEALGRQAVGKASAALRYHQGVAYGRALDDRTWWKRNLVLGLRGDAHLLVSGKLRDAFETLAAAPASVPTFDPVSLCGLSVNQECG